MTITHMRALSLGRCYFLRSRAWVEVQKLRFPRWELGAGKGVWGVRASERREQAIIGGWWGVRELRERDGFSSHTSNYCVTGDWKGTAPGPREFAGAGRREGAAVEGGKGTEGQRGGREGRVEIKRVYDTGTLSIVLSFGFTSSHSH